MTPQAAKNVTTRAILIGFACVLALCATAWAASEKVLYRFHGKDGWGGGSVILDSQGALYGTTTYGGNACTGLGCGVVFQLTRDANGKWHETVLHDFAGSDGEFPSGTLIVDKAGNLYGTTVYGGRLDQCSNGGCGLVFELTPGAGGEWTYKVVHEFDVTDGAAPYGGLIFDSQGNLYGTTSRGGNTGACQGGCGVVFTLVPGAKGQWTETVLYTFQGGDGYEPLGPVTFDSAGNLYGTTEVGGAHGSGTVFKLTPGEGGKWAEKVLHSFDETDGSYPGSALVFDASGNLYGTTPAGGPYNWGTVFRLTPGKDGEWTETVLRYFDEHKVGGGDVGSGLIFDAAGNLYGTAAVGGKYTCPGNGDVACGVIFRLTPHANGKWIETVLHSFGRGNDGAGPGGGLAMDPAGHLFGVTGDGGYVGGPCGEDGCGVVFEVTP